jgi:hypothetical protein
MDLATHRWDGSAYLSYRTRKARFRRFVNWPHTCSNQSSTALSEAGFFHFGKRRQSFSFPIKLPNCILDPTIFHLTYRSGRLECVFPLWRMVRFWQLTDDPWKEHVLWFAYCVFLRYVKGTEFVRECQNSQQSITSAPDSSDGRECTFM